MKSYVSLQGFNRLGHQVAAKRLSLLGITCASRQDQRRQFGAA